MTAERIEEIPEGWTVQIVSPDGDVIDDLDVGGQDLRRSWWAGDFAENVMLIVERGVAK